MGRWDHGNLTFPRSGGSTYDAPCMIARRESGSLRTAGGAGPTSVRPHALCAGTRRFAALLGGKSRRTRAPRDGSRHRRQDHLHTDRTVPPQLLGECAHELHCTNEALAPTSDCRRRLAWLSTTTSPRLGSPLSVVAVALHPPLLHRFPSKSHLVGSSSSFYQVFYTGNSVSLTTTRLWRLHCTAQAHHGHTQTRVDLRVAPLLL
jgi:hypothetical protein